LIESVVPVIAALSKSDELVEEFMTRSQKIFEDEIKSVFRLKTPEMKYGTSWNISSANPALAGLYSGIS